MIRPLIAAAAALALAACAERPLTSNERAFVATIHGDAVDLAPVRLVDGSVTGVVTTMVTPRERTTCTDRLFPPAEAPYPAKFPAFALGDDVFFITEVHRADFLADWPSRIALTDAMRLAHEITHVWQWQHRDRLGYSPLAAAREHRGAADPYLFDAEVASDFLDYGWEQQGSIVGEYVCCRTLDPAGARTTRLRTLLAPHFPGVAAGDGPRVAQAEVPWAGVEPRGICD